MTWHRALPSLSTDAAIDALGQTTRLLHDPLGRLLRVTQPDGAQQHYRWDADGNLCAYTDAQGATTGYRYDGLGQPVERTDAHGKDPALRLRRRRPPGAPHQRSRGALPLRLLRITCWRTEDRRMQRRRRNFGRQACG
ncbi:RHS repeat domain-containing protein [Sphingomonas sp. NCPPB 2930]